jgi:putative membrane protein
MPGMGDMGPMAPPSLVKLVAFAPSWFFLVCCLLAAGLYLAGVARLLRRGDRWPLARTAAWLGGLATVLLVTCTGIGRYGMVLFSVHMFQHMVLSMLSPILLLLAAPITLALRAVRPAPSRRGPRELLVAVLRSRVARVVTSPLVTLPLFIASLYGLYFSPIFDVLMGSPVGHDYMLVHFVVVGLAFFWPIMGTDPAPHRPPYVFRMLELFIGMPFHAFFGIAVMQSASLLTTTFAHPPVFWGINALTDQHTGGAIAWAFSEAPTLLVLGALFTQWFRDEDRQARRRDRAADRDGDAELAAYNAYLARINAEARRR